MTIYIPKGGATPSTPEHIAWTAALRAASEKALKESENLPLPKIWTQIKNDNDNNAGLNHKSKESIYFIPSVSDDDRKYHCIDCDTFGSKTQTDTHYCWGPNSARRKEGRPYIINNTNNLELNLVQITRI